MSVADERRDAGLVERGEQQPAGDADAFGDIIILRALGEVEPAAALGEDDDQPGGGLEEGLVGAGAERVERVEPFLAGAAGVEAVLLLLRGDPDRCLGLGRGNRGEVPGLVVGAAGGGARRADRRLDDGAGHGAVGEMAAASPGGHRLAECLGALEAFGVGKRRPGLPGESLIVRHGANLRLGRTRG
jgi:hypothetical protein